MGKEFNYYKEIREQSFLFDMLYMREAEKIKEIARKLHNKMIKRIIFTGCGDAYDNAVYSAQCFNYMTARNITAFAVEPFEFLHQNDYVMTNDALVVFSVKGRSKLVMEMMEKLQGKIYIIAVTNEINSPIAQMSDDVIFLDAGQWVGPRTKVYTLALYVGLLLAAAYHGDVKIWNELGKLYFYINQVLEDHINWNHVVKNCSQPNGITFVEYGMNWATAYMGRAKVKEVLRWDADVYELEEFAHTATVAPSIGRLTVFCCENSPLLNRISEIIVLAGDHLKRDVLLICSQSVWEKMSIPEGKCNWILLPDVMKEAEPILQSIVLQILMFHIAIHNGINPDHPPLRQLARETAFVEKYDGDDKDVSTKT